MLKLIQMQSVGVLQAVSCIIVEQQVPIRFRTSLLSMAQDVSDSPCTSPASHLQSPFLKRSLVSFMEELTLEGVLMLLGIIASIILLSIVRARKNHFKNYE